VKKTLRIALRTGVVLAILFLVISIAAIFVFRSDWFRERVRERAIAEIEKATGARVEIGSFNFDTNRLTATFGPLVLHGLEHAGEPPLLTIRSVTIGLRIISMLERKVDLASLNIDQPAAHVVFYADGSTNLPAPRVQGSKTWAESLVDLAVGRYEIADGLLDYGYRRIPLNVRGENLRMKLEYEISSGRYRGDLAFQRVRVEPPGFAPIEVNADGAFAFDKSNIDISRLRISTKDSRADLSGTLADVRSPHGTLKVKSTVSVREAAQMFQLPIAHTGKASFDGQIALSLASPLDFTLSGRVDAQDLGYTQDRVKIAGVGLRANVDLTADRLKLDRVALTAHGATVTGAAELLHKRDFHFSGKFEGLTVTEAAKFATETHIPWSGNMSGNLTAEARVGDASSLKLQTTVAIAPAPGGPQPIEGQAAISYEQASGIIRISDSHISTSATRLDFSGDLSGTLSVHAQTTNLDDLLPALALAEDNPPKELPIKLNPAVNPHRAEFQGTLIGVIGATGAPENPKFRGQVTIAGAIVEGHSVDRISATLDGTRHQINFAQLTVSRGATQLNGSASIAERNGSLDDAAISAQLTVANAQLGELLPEFAKELKLDTPITGTATATVRLSGTVRQPEADIAAQIEKVTAFGEQVDRLTANVKYNSTSIDVSAGEADAYGGKLRFQGSFQHTADDFKNGSLRYDITVQGLALARIERLKKLAPDAGAMVDGKANGTAHLVKGEFALDSINGDATARNVVWDKQPRGDLTVNAETHGSDLAIRANAKLQNLTVDAQGSWKLTGDEPGTAIVRVSRASVASLHKVLLVGTTMADSVLPFEGFIDGAHGTVSVALRKPRDFRAELTIDQVQLNAKPAQTFRLGVQEQDLVVKNSKPVSLEITSKEARIKSAEFSARDTILEVTGAVPFDPAAGGAGLTVHGSVNLIILQLLNPDLVARGNATVQASLKGALSDPQLSGRMELKNASLYLSDLPNGVDNANGTLIFDHDRATIEKLTAETGGGTIKFSGFIGFGSTLVYRLQAIAEKVRVRYPEDVSTTFNATLALNGNSDASTVSGMVTLTRASITPRADFAQVLAQTGHPASASVAASDYVRGMQFDVRIESGPNFEFQTSLTRNLEAGIDLRLRGTPLRPVLIGSVAVNDGEVQMFGNRYAVNRGDIRFINPVKVDPIFDMDLETKVRGVTVNITISGTSQKLSVNYSSDPPMQARDIIALLAVGRTPTESTGLSSPSATTATNMNDVGGGLIGQALSAQVNSRLQRFFGASRVKIDPTINSVDYLPQARLTLEQQVSKDITLTYITNLNRTQEQIVQIEWDFNRHWSAVAIREASGLFGIDFQYKKRFK
jgi:translocation and assembly module TamB